VTTSKQVRHPFIYPSITSLPLITHEQGHLPPAQRRAQCYSG
jgi:hypothetical protein